jgi:D-sedoheptulose 7-phosphate isomerase
VLIQVWSGTQVGHCAKVVLLTSNATMAITKNGKEERNLILEFFYEGNKHNVFFFGIRERVWYFYFRRMNEIRRHFEEAQDLLSQLLSDNTFIASVESAGQLMVESLRQGGKIISCGNGGSMCDAMHFAEELTGRYRDNRPSIAAISISDPSHISCVANDYGYEFVFSRFIEGVGFEGDVLLGISTSGNSANVIEAAKRAREKGMKVICLTGKDGGKLAGLCDVEVRVPWMHYADRIQEIHIKVIHSLIDYIEKNK